MRTSTVKEISHEGRLLTLLNLYVSTAGVRERGPLSRLWPVRRRSLWISASDVVCPVAASSAALANSR